MYPLIVFGKIDKKALICYHYSTNKKNNQDFLTKYLDFGGNFMYNIPVHILIAQICGVLASDIEEIYICKSKAKLP